MRCLIRRFEKQFFRGFNFVMDVWYYRSKGHAMSRSVELARDTIYP